MIFNKREQREQPGYNIFGNFNQILPNEDPFQMEKKRKIRKKFTEAEDQKLRELVQKYGDRSWNLVSSLMENRSQRQCRERWKHYLSIDLSESSKPWTKEEDDLIFLKYKELGPKWTKIAKELKGRSDLQVKMRYFKKIKNSKKKVDFYQSDDNDDLVREEEEKKNEDLSLNNDEKKKENVEKTENIGNSLSLNMYFEEKNQKEFNDDQTSPISEIFDFDIVPSNLLIKFYNSGENFLCPNLEPNFYDCAF